MAMLVDIHIHIIEQMFSNRMVHELENIINTD